jgi:hypothetical protein
MRQTEYRMLVLVGAGYIVLLLVAFLLVGR